jgi:hypothetical protein
MTAASWNGATSEPSVIFPTINSFPHAMLVSYYRGSWFASCLYSRYVAISDIVYFHTLIVWLSSSYVHIVHCCTSTVPYDIIGILQHKPPHERLLWSLIRCVSQHLLLCNLLQHFSQDYSCLYVSRSTPLSHLTSVQLTRAALLAILVVLPRICSGPVRSYRILLACYA